MSTHIATVRISLIEFERINRLLNIDSLEDMSGDELIAQGANTNSCEGVFLVAFDDGSTLNFDLCSGSSNYFDDVVWSSSDGSVDITLDCAYELDDIEVDVEGETYIVKIIQE
jgi:hypothetical protein